MKNLFNFLVSGLAAALFLFPGDAFGRTWTDVQGRTLEADLVSYSSDGVQLAWGGKTRFFALHVLSAGDRQFLERAGYLDVSDLVYHPSFGPVRIPDGFYIDNIDWEATRRLRRQYVANKVAGRPPLDSALPSDRGYVSREVVVYPSLAGGIADAADYEVAPPTGETVSEYTGLETEPRDAEVGLSLSDPAAGKESVVPDPDVYTSAYDNSTEEEPSPVAGFLLLGGLVILFVLFPGLFKWFLVFIGFFLLFGWLSDD